MTSMNKVDLILSSERVIMAKTLTEEEEKED
jgi:hypothetical protein